jgi:hypothetical protein
VTFEPAPAALEVEAIELDDPKLLEGWGRDRLWRATARYEAVDVGFVRMTVRRPDADAPATT